MESIEGDKENIAIETEPTAALANSQEKQSAFEKQAFGEKQADTNAKNQDECLIIIGGGNKNSNSLQDHFNRFRKRRTEEIKYKQFLSSKNKNVDRKDPAFKQRLREKFVETAKKYYGVPYAKRYHQPGDPHYNSPIFLDCCALVRQVVYDLREEFGFKLDRWNQCYQVDTLPIDLKEEEMKPGDLVFYSATYYNPRLKSQKHDMVHVEIFMGGPTGEQSIGARWQKGVVQLFDSYKFVSTSYHSIKFHYKSIDTWLEGICRSWCSEHKWQSSNLLWAPNKKSIFTDEEEYTEADLEAPGCEEGEVQEQQLTYFIGKGNNPALAKDSLINRGYIQLPKGMNWSDNYRFKWVQTPQEVNFMRFIEGTHIVNHISNCWIFTNKVTTLDTIENLKISLKSGEIVTPLHPDQFFPETYKLNFAPDLVKFLNQKDEGYWLLKKKSSNCGRGITLISDVKKYKDDIMTKEVPIEVKPEVAEIPNSSTDLLLQKMKEMGLETTVEQKSAQVEVSATEKIELPAVIEEVKSEPTQTTRVIKNLRAIVNDMDDAVVQKYIGSPLLYKKKKFDLRVYMIICCTKPYLVLFNHGYCRISLNEFNLEDYNSKEGKITHMTNNSVQKKHPEYKDRKEETIISIEELRDYLISEGVIQNTEEFTSKITNKIKEIMRIIFLQSKDKLDRTYGCFELLGWDFMLDDKLNPYLIEININPALFTDTSVQTKVIPKVVDDLIDIVLKVHKPLINHARDEDVNEVIESILKSSEDEDSKKYDLEFLYADDQQSEPFI